MRTNSFKSASRRLTVRLRSRKTAQVNSSPFSSHRSTLANEDEFLEGRPAFQKRRTSSLNLRNTVELLTNSNKSLATAATPDNEKQKKVSLLSRFKMLSVIGRMPTLFRSEETLADEKADICCGGGLNEDTLLLGDCLSMKRK